MSESNSKQPDKAPATPVIESPKEGDELATEDLDKVAGGMRANTIIKKPVRLSEDPCAGGE